MSKHNIRVSGKFATTEQKMRNDERKWKDTALYFQSVLVGTYRKVRRLTDENRELKNKLKTYENMFLNIENDSINSEKRQ